jgi:GxxExxY protein
MVDEARRDYKSGFLESVYEKSLAMVLEEKGFTVRCQYPVKVLFRSKEVGQFYADLLVNEKVIVELKAVKSLIPEHFAQVIHYLKATGFDVGLIINFGNQKLEYRRFTRTK